MKSFPFHGTNVVIIKCLAIDVKHILPVIPAPYKDWHLYHMRHEDDCEGCVASIEKQVVFNHYGILLAENLLPFPPKNDSYIEISREDQTAIDLGVIEPHYKEK